MGQSFNGGLVENSCGCVSTSLNHPVSRLQLDHMTTSHYTGYPVSSFVTVTVALDLESNGEVSTNAYMVSDLVRRERDKM